MTVYCPQCDADITDSYEETDESVGVSGGYYCYFCDIPVEVDDDGSYDDDNSRDYGDETKHP